MMSFLVRINGEVKGPLSTEQVRGLLTAGVITGESEVQIEGVDAWVPVRSVRVVS